MKALLTALRWTLCACSLLVVAGCPTQETLLTTAGGTGTNGLSLPSTAAGDSGQAIPIGPPDALTQNFPACGVPATANEWRLRVLELVNRERTSRGLQALIINATLEQQAETYACELIQHDFFAHENPVTGTGLTERSAQFGYDYQYIGENLAAGQQSPEEAIFDWMTSPSHRANILHPSFEEIGIAVRSGGDYGYYWVQEFGQPRRVPAAIR